MRSAIVVLGLLVAARISALAAVFTVTTAEDTSRKLTTGYSLRDAINDANATGGKDVIGFAIPGAAVARIYLTQELPSILEAVVIDGYTQPGARPNTLTSGSDAVLQVEIDGRNTVGNLSRALFIRANDCLIRGLILNNCLNAGLVISFGNDNVIAGNWIGVQANGATPSFGRRNQDGIWVLDGARNRIGGLAPADRNLISGNRDTGIAIGGVASSDNLVLNNYVGTDRSGRIGVPNGGGVLLGSPDNILGDGSTQGRNVISGNSGFGVQVSPWNGARARGNKIAGNFIGLAADGDALLSNGASAIVLVDAAENTIGNPDSARGNVISGNAGAGIFLLARFGGVPDTNIATRDNMILGNYIGTDFTGKIARGNGASGIVLSGDLFGTLTGNQIGALVQGTRAGNLISGNLGNGVQVTGAKPPTTASSRILSVSTAPGANRCPMNGAAF